MSTPPNPLQPAAPANRSGSLIPWLLGMIGAGVVILGLFAFATVRFILREGTIRKQGRQVTISTPLGELKVDHGAEPGLPKYPGASIEKESASVELTAPTDDKLEIIAAHYFTSDALDRVDAWYGRTLGNDFEREGSGEKRTINNSHIPYLHIESSETAYVSDRKDIVRLVVLNERPGGVEIKLVRIGPREVQ
jgi:hypothetical protein